MVKVPQPLKKIHIAGKILSFYKICTNKKRFSWLVLHINFVKNIANKVHLARCHVEMWTSQPC
ncbi:hypothetical protein Geoth_1910 [Parageobacillus thermoglucosidasius C56-YS93]|nr:hypothetical protein Geoth_1910 [Parageobacillus thermoglucosidasius C56-YS93]